MNAQEKQLTNKKGNLRGIRATVYNPDTGEWNETGTTGWVLRGLNRFKFFIGIGELGDSNGYQVEIEVSGKALRAMLDVLNKREFQALDEPFSEAPDKYDYLDGDFPT